MFSFLKKVESRFEDVTLHKEFDAWETGKNEKYPMHRYAIMVDNFIVGSIDFRQGNDPWLYWGGHIGYNIAQIYRGNHYAYKACVALIPIMHSYGFDHVYISASPENIASIKTIEHLNVELLQEGNVEPGHWLIRQGEPVKRVYLWKF